MQKFHRGDLVHVAKDLGSMMSYFTSDVDAIVEYSYNDRYGGGNTKSYSIYIKGKGKTAWYYEHQLTLIEKNRLDLMLEWEAEERAECKMKSDLDWIFEHGKEVLKSTHGASVQALASCFGLDNLWGSRGEGFIWYQNAMQTMAIAKPYLEESDKNGWLELCEEIKANQCLHKDAQKDAHL